MKIGMAYFAKEHGKNQMILSRQMGVYYAVSGASGHDFMSNLGKLKRFKDMGIKLAVIEGPTSLDKVKLGLPGKDEEIEKFCTLLENLGRLKIDTVCYNWMPKVGWFRTSSTIKSRGDALVTGFDYSAVKDAPPVIDMELTHQDMWDNLLYFLKAVVPVAEKTGVKLAIHPDDPPVERLFGIPRILINGDAFKKVIDMVPSDFNGITMCQGSFSAMGENIPELIRYFGNRKKLFFAHFRDIRGTAKRFEETFHDDGQQDMYEAMKAYYEVGFDGILRPDHVPTMEGEENTNPGYGILGNLYAIGYMKGLMEAIEKVK